MMFANELENATKKDKKIKKAQLIKKPERHLKNVNTTMSENKLTRK